MYLKVAGQWHSETEIAKKKKKIMSGKSLLEHLNIGLMLDRNLNQNLNFLLSFQIV